ncbi:glycosyltransferase [Salinarimonas rosea]|uniref:glycosyltransferase n=1 Tax=Salinarimonas rosea TaxID=552063 RepID=UPI0003F9F130|nr:glycosyltransferase family 2 protein [Salinarimonas rosea]
MPAVDVTYLIPAFRAQATIEAALRSAVAQEGVRVEAIVVDDASDDDTAAVVARLAAREPRIRLVRLPENRGPSAARNAAIAEASGRFLGVLDADDTLAPGRTRALLDLATMTGAEIAADDLVRLDASGAAAGRALPAGATPYAFMLDPASYCADNVPMAGRFGTGYLKPIIASAFVAERQLAYDPSVRLGEDFLFCLEAMLAGARYVVSSTPGYLYAARPGSLSHRIAATRLAELEAGLDRVASRRMAAAAEPATAQAIARYRAGLGRAHGFLEAVETAKEGRHGVAAARLGRDPALWPLALRYGGEAAANRLPGRRRARGAAQ